MSRAVIVSVVVLSMLSRIAKAEESKSDDNKDRSPPPCVCPLWELAAFGGGIYLYYSEFFESACTDPPQVVYAYGAFPLSPGCDTNCFAAHRGMFPGLDRPLNPRVIWQMPAGPAADHARVLIDPKITFIEFVDSAGDTKRAKVFAIHVDRNRRGMTSKQPERVIYAAFEVSEPVPSGNTVEIVKCEPLDSGDECYAYRTSYDTDNSMSIPILVFTVGKPEKKSAPTKSAE